MFACLRRVRRHISSSLPTGQSCTVTTGVHRFSGISYIYVDNETVATLIGAVPATPPRASPVFFVTYGEDVFGGGVICDFP